MGVVAMNGDLAGVALNGDGRFNGWMRIVAFNLEIIELIIEDRSRFTLDYQLR